jgi:PilZ domain
MNISLGGVYFVTSQPVSIGLPVQVLLRMPSRIAGSPSNKKVFTGRVSHVERKEIPGGSSGVGIEFFYCEIPPREVQQVGRKQNIEERAHGEASSVSNCRP